MIETRRKAVEAELDALWCEMREDVLRLLLAKTNDPQAGEVIIADQSPEGRRVVIIASLPGDVGAVKT